MNGRAKITIAETEVGLLFAYPAVRMFTEASFNKAEIYFTPDSLFTPEGLAKLLQCGYKNWCIIKETEPSLDYEAFYDYVDAAQDTDQGRAELEQVLTVYTEASVMKKAVALVEEKKSQLAKATGQ